MTEKCFVRWPNRHIKEEIEWLIIDATHASTIENGTIETLLASLSETAELILCLPGDDVVTTLIDLPKGSRSKIEQALPFLVEDNISEDVDTLHFTPSLIPDREKKHGLAWIAENQIQAFLAYFADAEKKPKHCISETFLLPFEEEQWNLLLDKHKCWLRKSPTQGFCVEHSNLNTLLLLNLQQAVTDHQTPKQINIYKTKVFNSEKVEFNEALDVFFTANAIHLNVIEQTKELLMFATRPHIGNQPYEFLSGSYAIKEKNIETKRLWYWVGGLALGWFCLSVVGNFIVYAQLKKEDNVIQQKYAQFYKMVFPEAQKTPANPRAALEAIIRNKKMALQNEGFLGLLADVGKVLKKQAENHITYLEFRNNQLILSLDAKSFSSLEQFNQALQQENLTVKVNAAARQGERVEARMTIEGQ